MVNSKTLPLPHYCGEGGVGAGSVEITAVVTDGRYLRSKLFATNQRTA